MTAREDLELRRTVRALKGAISDAVGAAPQIVFGKVRQVTPLVVKLDTAVKTVPAYSGVDTVVGDRVLLHYVRNEYVVAANLTRPVGPALPTGTTPGTSTGGNSSSIDGAAVGGVLAGLLPNPTFNPNVASVWKTVQTAHAWAATLTGSTGRFVGSLTEPPAGGAFDAGDFVVDPEHGVIYVCTLAGAPGHWETIGGAGTSSGSTTGVVTPPPFVSANTGLAATPTKTGAKYTMQADAPSGIAEGNLLLAVVTTERGSATMTSWTAPTGWEELFTHFSTELNVGVYYKWAGADEPVEYTFAGNYSATLDTTNFVGSGYVQIAQYTDVSTTTPFTGTPSLASTSTSNTVTGTPSAPSVTGSVNQRLVCFYGAESGPDVSTTVPWPSGMTGRATWIQTHRDEASTTDWWLADRALTSAGATGAKALTGITATIPWGLSILLNPAGGGAIPQAAMYQSTAQTLETGVTVTLTGMTETFVRGGATVASNKITVPVSGVYRVAFQIMIAQVAATLKRFIGWAYAGDTFVIHAEHSGPGYNASTPTVGATREVYLAAGTEVSLQALQDTAGTLKTVAASSKTYLCVTYVQP